MTEPFLPADLVLEGGGVKGIGLAGAVTELLGRYRFRRVAGTSAGAVAAAFVAAGLDADGVREVLGRLRYDRIPDAWLPVPTGLSSAGGLLLREGAHPGRYVHEWLRSELAGLGVTTFGDLRRDDPGDDPNLTPEQQYKLVVMATDVTRGRLVRLPWDYAEYGLEPDEQPVADAVRMSLSIPLYFAPCALTDRSTGRRSTIVDGGVLSNFPIEVFDRTDDVAPRWPTFGVGITDALEGDEVPSLASSVLPPWVLEPVPAIRLIDAVLATAVSGHDRTYLARPCVRRRAFSVDTREVGLTDFDIDEPARQRLFENGQEAAREFLARWDWAAYLHDCRGVR
jgi:NTE family protein